MNSINSRTSRNSIKAFFYLFAAFALAAFAASGFVAAADVNFTISNVSGPFNVTLGNWTQNYSVTYNLTVNGTVYNTTVRIFMPYGMQNATSNACNGTTGNVTYGAWFNNLTPATVCAINFSSLAAGSTNVTILVKANVSAFTAYYPYGAQPFYAVVNSSVNSTGNQSAVTMRYAVNYWINPRPYALVNPGSSNVSLTFKSWNQTDSFYVLQLPIQTFNQTSKRPGFSNASFADIMYQTGSMLERPSYVRMYTYNLTFTLSFNGTGSQTIVLWSPINESSSQAGCTWGGMSDCPPQSIMPIFTRNETQTDFMDNVTFNMTIGVPSPTEYDVYINGTNYNSTGALALGFNASFVPGMMQNIAGAFIITATNATALNNTPITLLFTVMNQTYSSGPGEGGLRPTSPVFVDWQQVSGFSQGPQFGENVSVSYLGRVRNALSNFTLSNVSLSYFLPLNATFSPFFENGSCCNWTANQSFTMASSDRMSWNNTAESDWTWTTEGVTNRTSCQSFNDSKPGSPTSGMVYVCFRIYALRLDNATRNYWNPGSANSNVTINFTAMLSYPPMAEDNFTPGGEGSTNSYNVTFNPPMRTAMNLTDKVPGIASAGCANTVITLNGQTLTCDVNFTIGSLFLNDVSTGNQQVSITYTIPAAVPNPNVGGAVSTPTPAPCATPTPVATPTAAGAAVAPTVAATPAWKDSGEESESAPTGEPSFAASSVSENKARASIAVVSESIALAKTQGVNVAEAERFLALARQALNGGQYALAEENARLAENALTQAKAAGAKRSVAGGIDLTLVGVIVLIVLLGAAYFYFTRKNKQGL